MDRKRIGWLLVALGVVLFVVAAGADAIGIGNDDGVGWKQITGMITGAIVAAAGILAARRSELGPAADDV